MCRFRYPTSKEQVLNGGIFSGAKGDLLFFAGHPARKTDLVKTYDQKPDTDRDWERIDVFCGG